MSVSTTVSGTEFLPMVNGRAWEFARNGATFQIISLNGSERIALWVRLHGQTEWVHGHTRDLNGRSTADVAREMHADVMREDSR